MELCGLYDYCDIVIRCLDSHSDGTHSLQRIHWWASDAMLNFSKSVTVKKQTISWMAWGWVHFQKMFIFGCILGPLCTDKHKHIREGTSPEPFHQHPDSRLPRNMTLMLKCTSGSQQYSMTFQLCKAGKVKIETSERRFVWKCFHPNQFCYSFSIEEMLRFLNFETPY